MVRFLTLPPFVAGSPFQRRPEVSSQDAEWIANGTVQATSAVAAHKLVSRRGICSRLWDLHSVAHEGLALTNRQQLTLHYLETLYRK